MYQGGTEFTRLQNSHGLFEALLYVKCKRPKFPKPVALFLRVLTNLLPKPVRAEALVWCTHLPMRLEYAVSAMFCTAPYIVCPCLPCYAHAARQ